MLLFLSYIVLLLNLLKNNPETRLKELVLKTTLFFSTFIVVITEVLSIFKSLNLFSVILLWSLASVVLFFMLIKSRKTLLLQLSYRKTIFIKSYTTFSFFEKTLLWSVVVFIGLLLFQGIIYPPNNWDSLTYHMSRIMYWISNESVAHFPTHIIRHLYQPPFAEYFILHVNLLNGNDYLSNSVQLFYLINCCVAVGLILDEFKTPRLYQLLAVLLIITIPSVELQATTTKNDIVCAFFILASCYYCIKSYVSGQYTYFVLLGLSLGLAFLTKGTAYLFLIPILLCYGLLTLIRMIRTKKYTPLLYGVVVILLSLLLNTGHYLRNYQIDGDILNIDKIEAQAYSNQNMNGKLYFSNLLKNAALHLGYPLAGKSDALLKMVHTELDIPLNNPDTSYYNTPYEAAKAIATHEDLVSNTIPFLLFVFALCCLLFSFRKYKQNIPAILVTTLVVLQILFFCAYLKWQPWHTRLHIPMFILSIVSIILIAKHSKWLRYAILAAVPFLYFSFFFFFIYNNTRPIVSDKKLTAKVRLEDPRFKKYFANKLSLQNEYADVLNSIYDNEPEKIGLIIDEWEYPLFHNFYYEPVKIIAIQIHNISEKIPQDESGMDFVISDHINQEFIIHNGKKYYNITPDNSYIWAYK